MNNLNDIKQNATTYIKNDSRQKWCNYAWTIRNYVISYLGDLPDTVIGKGWVIISIYEIADSIKAQHGDAASLKTIQLLYSLFTLVSDKVEALKSGADTVSSEMVDMATIVSLAELFNSLNPSYGMEKWLSILEITFNLVLNLIAARAAHEWQADMKYHYMILDSLITISDGVSCDRDSFKCESFNGE